MTNLPADLAALAFLLDAYLCLRHKCRQPAPVFVRCLRVCVKFLHVEGELGPRRTKWPRNHEARRPRSRLTWPFHVKRNVRRR